jgi:AraC family transcriptional regulator of adaptative response/methylated-DNA-[protein]-cysteine methyltransferase
LPPGEPAGRVDPKRPPEKRPLPGDRVDTFSVMILDMPDRPTNRAANRPPSAAAGLADSPAAAVVRPFDEAPTPTAMPSVAVMRRAFAEKDPGFDGLFVVAVKTTGVFCRPVCRAKPPKPENVEFFPTPAAAARKGYRPCKLCRPTDSPAAPPPAVARLVRLAAESGPARVTSADLTEAGVDPTTARRLFRQHLGMTFAAYKRVRRLAAAVGEAKAGRGAVTAQVAAGFESASGFRAAARRATGAASASDLADAVVLTSARVPTPLGPMLAVVADASPASAAGLVVCDFEDRVGLAAAVERARVRLGTPRRPAMVVPGEHPLLAQVGAELANYFAGRRRAFDVPLAVGGTAFQRRAWEYLRQIPYGQTRAYSRQATDLGTPAAVRAVGRANGANYLSILIPCHRVVAADGSLVGYGGGLARKRWLIDHERRVAARGT